MSRATNGSRPLIHGKRISDSSTNKQKFSAGRVVQITTPTSRKRGRTYNADSETPHDPYIEKIVLGSIMMDGPAALRQCDGLTAKAFYLPSHCTIYRALTALVNEGVEKPDFTLLADRLTQSGELERVGGRDYLMSLTEDLPRSLNITPYVNSIRQLYRRRQGIEIFERAAADLRGYVPADEVFARLQAEVRGVVAGARTMAPAGEPSTELILTRVEKFVRRFWVLPKEDDYLVATMWYVATHLAMIFEVFPYLYITAPEKGCGKTRGLELGDLLCVNPWMGIAPSTASLYRMMMDCPTR